MWTTSFVGSLDHDWPLGYFSLSPPPPPPLLSFSLAISLFALIITLFLSIRPFTTSLFLLSGREAQRFRAAWELWYFATMFSCSLPLSLSLSFCATYFHSLINLMTAVRSSNDGKSEQVNVLSISHTVGAFFA